MVQVERMTLSPLLYALWLGAQHVLLVRGMTLTYATVVGGAVGIFVTRILHTLWMIRQQRRWTKKAALAAAIALGECPRCTCSLAGLLQPACPGCGCTLPPVVTGPDGAAPAAGTSAAAQAPARVAPK
jgi:hypothetical protein